MGKELVLPNAVIAGTNKAGTTSLFRYLSEHPDVCPAKIKELTFFSDLDEPISPEVLSRYATYFDHCPASARVRLEASPNYLTKGRRVAELLREAIPDTRLIFILREPSSRLLSNFQRRKERLHEDASKLTLEEYLELMLENAHRDEAANQADPMSQEFKSVMYAGLLREYLEVFPREQIKVMFFDDLSRDSHEFVKRVCEFLELDASFYDDFTFHVENKTRSYRFKKLQKLAWRTNMRLEPLLNRVPGARRWLRGVYNAINEKKSNGEASSLPPQMQRLRDFFTEQNRELGELLHDHYPGIALPDWVSSSSAAMSGQDR